MLITNSSLVIPHNLIHKCKHASINEGFKFFVKVKKNTQNFFYLKKLKEIEKTKKTQIKQENQNKRHNKKKKLQKRHKQEGKKERKKKWNK